MMFRSSQHTFGVQTTTTGEQLSNICLCLALPKSLKQGQAFSRRPNRPDLAGVRLRDAGDLAVEAGDMCLLGLSAIFLKYLAMCAGSIVRGVRPKRYSTMAVSFPFLLLCLSTVVCSSCAVNGTIVAGEAGLLQFTAVAKQGVLSLLASV